MTMPALIYSFLIASFIGSAFHLWKGGGGGRLLMMMILSWMGFYLGHRVGVAWEIKLFMIGPVYGGFGILGSLFLLLLGNWVSQLDD